MGWQIRVQIHGYGQEDQRWNGEKESEMRGRGVESTTNMAGPTDKRRESERSLGKEER